MLILSAGTPETRLFIHYLLENQLRIQSISNRYFLFENGGFQASTPVNQNELFESVTVGHGNIALRLVHYGQLQTPESGSGSGSGSGSDAGAEEQAMASDCYVGFQDRESEPMCYGSTNFAATRFVIIH